MSYNATIVPIEWDEFMDLLSAIDSLPGPPGPELGECVWQAIRHMPEQHYVFGRFGPYFIERDLESIKFSPQHRRKLQQIFAMIFGFPFSVDCRFSDDVDWEQRYYDFSKIQLPVQHSLCSPQDARSVYETLRELSPDLMQYERNMGEITPAPTWSNLLRQWRGEQPQLTDDQKREAEGRGMIFTYAGFIMGWCEKYSRESKGFFTYWI